MAKSEANQIRLTDYTPERCHEFWQQYVVDPMMLDGEYHYDKALVDTYYRKISNIKTRRYFSICLSDLTIGEIQLKNIDFEAGFATLSIHMANDEYKNSGYGTEAIRLIIEIAFTQLNLKKLFADTIHRNVRSQHVLGKLGFIYTHSDDQKKYFVLYSN